MTNDWLAQSLGAMKVIDGKKSIQRAIQANQENHKVCPKIGFKLLNIRKRCPSPMQVKDTFTFLIRIHTEHLGLHDSLRQERYRWCVQGLPKDRRP